ncbi:MAG TPA: hypothetical protein VI612_03495 [Candidatus Nanoarchaeia archaeon]|nr:hypothetical protein [Candidatus Nanoarchaeia archaeon]
MELALDWPEFWAVVFMVVGFAFALFSDNLVVAYIVVFLMGLLFGRVWHRGKKTNRVPLFLSIIFFLLGFMIGSLFASLQVIVLLMLAGVVLGYWLHEKGIIHSV